MYRRVAVACVLSLGLYGCATLDEGQCLAGDWPGIGFSDGASGYPMSRLDEHAEACAKHGVTPDAAAYRRGRDQGLQQYCTAENGFRVGVNGSGYNRVCPGNIEQEFLYGYADGQRVHAAVTALNNARSEITRHENRDRQIETEIRAEEAKIGDSALTDEQRDAARARVRRLRDDRDRVRDDIRRAEREERRMEREVADLRAALTPRYGAW